MITSVIFDRNYPSVPYWFAFSDLNIRKKFINSYHLNKQLSNELFGNNKLNKKLKI